MSLSIESRQPCQPVSLVSPMTLLLPRINKSDLTVRGSMSLARHFQGDEDEDGSHSIASRHDCGACELLN